MRDRFSDFVERVNRHHERIVITRNGTPAAVLLSPEDLESLEETLAILADTGALEAIAQAEREVAEGDVIRMASKPSEHCDLGECTTVRTDGRALRSNCHCRATPRTRCVSSHQVGSRVLWLMHLAELEHRCRVTLTDSGPRAAARFESRSHRL